MTVMTDPDATPRQCMRAAQVAARYKHKPADYERSAARPRRSAPSIRSMWPCRCAWCCLSKMFTPNPNRPLRQTLLLGTVVIGAMILGAAILYVVTSWLWLVVHQGLH